MNIDLTKATEKANSLNEVLDYEKAKSIIKDFAETTFYYDEEDAKPSADLVNNENYKQLMAYLMDAHNVMSALTIANFSDERGEKVDDFMNNIDESETDLITYLDNFVYDDTPHPDVKTYLLMDFPDLETFALHFFKGYFQNNFLYYLNKL